MWKHYRPWEDRFWRQPAALGRVLPGASRGLEGFAWQLGLALLAAAFQLAPYAWPGLGFLPGALTSLPVAAAAALNPELAIVSASLAAYLAGSVTLPAGFLLVFATGLFGWLLGTFWHLGYSRRRLVALAAAGLWAGLLMLTYGVSGIPSFDALKQVVPVVTVTGEGAAALAWAVVWLAGLELAMTRITRSGTLGDAS